MNGWWTLFEDGTATQSGVNYDNAKSIQVWERKQRGDVDYIMLKIPGGKHWGGVGMDWAPHPGHYIIGKVTQYGEATEATPGRLAGSRVFIEVLFEAPLSERGRSR